jgi:hypothetical protein
MGTYPTVQPGGSMSDTMPGKYIDIDERLSQLRHRQAYLRNWIDDGNPYDPTTRKSPFNALDGLKMIEALREVEQEIARLETLSPCLIFAERYGWEIHEYFIAKYPINAQTKILVGREDSRGQYSYLDSERVVSLRSRAEPPPVVAPAEMKVATFEWWGRRDKSFFVRLAYALSINFVIESDRGKATDIGDRLIR